MNRIYRTIVFVIVLIVLIVLGVLLIKNNTVKTLVEYKNATYVIEGQLIKLTNGRSEVVTTPGSTSKTITQYFGNLAEGDLNGDGKNDVAFLVSQTNGGSGTYYYVVASLNTTVGYVGTNAILLGDRISPQTTQIKDGQIIVNYADRKSGEAMTVRPSVGVSKYLTVQGTTLVESPRVVGAGEHCGGNILNAPVCSKGFHCAPVAGSKLPFGDVGGSCVSD